MKKESNLPEYDSCVLCHTQLDIRSDTPIDQRAFYLVGAGQLCMECYRTLQPDNDIDDVLQRLNTLYEIDKP